MRLLVLSHKACWRAPDGAYVTDGGFPLQMEALSQLFATTVLALPCRSPSGPRPGTPLRGHGLRVAPLAPLRGRGLVRKLAFPLWLARQLPTLVRETLRADAVHAPVPGDVGTVGILLARVFRKRLFVRHCGSWEAPRTRADRLRRRLLERIAGGRTVVLATGGGTEAPSARNPAIGWVFSTSLRARQIADLAGAPRVRREAPRLITVSRQVVAKGTHHAIEALARLPDRRARLHVVGDGPALASLRARAARIGVADRVVFHGQVAQERVPALLREADLFVFPTQCSEGFPKVVLEALAAGLPVVASRVSVLPRLLGEGGGVPLDDCSAGALAEAIATCLADEARYRAMSECARRTASRYSLESWRDTIRARLEQAWGPLAEASR